MDELAEMQAIRDESTKMLSGMFDATSKTLESDVWKHAMIAAAGHAGSTAVDICNVADYITDRWRKRFTQQKET